jgi:hypothetical protein
MLAPHSAFATLGDFPLPSTSSPTIPRFVARDFDPKTAANAALILRHLQTISPFVLERERLCQQSKSMSQDYLSLFKTLSLMIQENCVGFLNDFLNDFLPIAPPLDAAVREIISHLAEHSPELLTSDLILRCFDRVTEDRAVTVQRIAHFLTDGVRDVEFEIPELLAKKFLELLIFTKASSMAERVGQLRSVVARVVHFHPAIVIDFIDNNFDRIRNSNFSSLLFCLEILDEKRPVLDALANALRLKQFLTIDELVSKSCACNAGDVTHPAEFFTLLSSPEFSENSRRLLWSVVMASRPPVSEFRRRFRYCGDWADQSLFLVQEIGVEDLLVRCIENSADAFVISFPWFIENGLETLLAPDVSAAVLRLEIGDHADEFVRFIRLLIEGKTKEKVDEALAAFVAGVRVKAEFLCRIWEDGIEAEDVRPLVGPLRVAVEIPEVLVKFQEEVAALMAKQTEFPKAEIPEVVAFIELVVQCAAGITT